MSEMPDIGAVLAVVRERKGVDFTQYRQTTLRRRLGRRMAACSCSDIDSYLQHILARPEEIDLLLADLTIKYSEFFRDPQVFDAFRGRVLPSIICHSRRDGGEVAIWSAGCAGGEEAYSLAALVRHWMDSTGQTVRASIIGTDIDPAALRAARAATYVKDFMPQGLDAGMAAYFADDGKRLTPLPALRELVSFHEHDLTGDSAAAEMRRVYPGRFDLILCRNVLIYLLRDAQARVIRLCCDLLRPGGFLVVGTKERLAWSVEGELMAVDRGLGIYEKPLPSIEGEVNA